MLVILGFIIVIGSVVGGYVLHNGQLALLYQPTEFLIIGGAGIGALIVSAPLSQIKMIMHQIMGALKPSISKEKHTELLLLLYELCRTAKQNPLSLEPHVENPETSEIFKKYPSVSANAHLLHFICDTLKVQITAPMSPYDLEELMDTDMSALHAEEAAGPATVNRIGDAMPGLGIVAAVLGVCITMGKLTEGKEVIGMSVAAALVGTFTGVVLSYGFFGPLAAKMECRNGEESALLQVAKSALLAFAKDASPKVCVEFARRKIPPVVRPNFDEIDKATANVKKAA